MCCFLYDICLYSASKMKLCLSRAFPLLMKSIKRMTRRKGIFSFGSNHLLLLRAVLALGAAMLSLHWERPSMSIVFSRQGE